METAPEHQKNKPRTGLAMEGGAMRGMFTCGVTDVFMENGITFDAAAGISAGAVFGCNYKSGQSGRALRYNKTYCRDPRYCSLRSLIRTGDLYGADFCYRELPHVLDPFDRETFSRDPMEFFVGATDVRTGEIVYHQCTDGGETDIRWMRASASMPVVSRPVAIGGSAYLDGGITDSIPYSILEQNGCSRIVIILTQPDGYRKKKNPFSAWMRIPLRRYPKIADAMAVRYERYNRQLEEIRERERAGSALVIRPPEALKIRRTENDPEVLESVYQTGRKTAIEALPRIREFLGEG